MGRPRKDPNIPRFCKKCNCSLQEFDNWGEGSVKKGFYMCNNCKNDRYKRYKLKNPFKVRLSYFNKRNCSAITVDQLEELWKTQEGKCAICRDFIYIKEKYCIDHKIPKSKGGSSELKNLQFTCYKCNIGKHNYSQEEYIEHCLKIAKLYSSEIHKINRISGQQSGPRF